MLENVQRRVTRLVFKLEENYKERSRTPKIPTIRYRRKRGRIIEIFKILTGRYDYDATGKLFEISNRETRGINMQLIPKSNLELRRNFFRTSAIDDWNTLPETVISPFSMDSLKTRLNKHSQEHMYTGNKTKQLIHKKLFLICLFYYDCRICISSSFSFGSFYHTTQKINMTNLKIFS